MGGGGGGGFDLGFGIAGAFGAMGGNEHARQWAERMFGENQKFLGEREGMGQNIYQQFYDSTTKPYNEIPQAQRESFRSLLGNLGYEGNYREARTIPQEELDKFNKSRSTALKSARNTIIHQRVVPDNVDPNILHGILKSAGIKNGAKIGNKLWQRALAQAQQQSDANGYGSRVQAIKDDFAAKAPKPYRDLRIDAPKGGDIYSQARDKLNGLFGDVQSTHDQFLNQLKGFSPEQFSAKELDLMRQLAAPYEQKARADQQSMLMGQGRLGTTGGSADVRQLYDSQGQADLQRVLDSIQHGRAEQSRLYGLAYNPEYSNMLQANTALTGNQVGALQQGLFNRALDAPNYLQGASQLQLNLMQPRMGLFDQFTQLGNNVYSGQPAQNITDLKNEHGKLNQQMWQSVNNTVGTWAKMAAA